MLHPRDRHGRFRKKWKMAAGVVDALSKFLDRFQPHSFQSDQQASQYAFNRRKAPWSTPELQRLHMDWDEANGALQAGKMDPTTKRFTQMMDRNMVETTDDLIVSQTVPTEAFGLSPQQAAMEDGGLEDLIGLEIADAGYSATSLGSELSHPPGSVTLRVAVPKGTRVAYGGRSPNDRAVIFDRDQPLVVTKVESDGRGGWYMLAIAGSGARTKGAAAVADDRTHGTRGAALTPEQREARISPQMSGESRLKIAQREQQQNEAATLRHQREVQGTPPPPHETPVPGPAPAPAPATPASPQTSAPPAAGVPERREPVHSNAVGPGSPEGRSASEVAQMGEEARATAAKEAATPAAPTPPTPLEFQEAARGLSVPTAGKQRSEWNKAHSDLSRGKRDPGDVLRELDTDIEENKRQAASADHAEKKDTLDRNIQAQEQLADLIAEKYGLQRQGREAKGTGDGTSPTPTPAAKKAPRVAPGAPSTKREATPKAPAPRSGKGRKPADIAADIQAAKAREEADAHLEGMTGAELKALADHMEAPVRARATKAELRKAIVFRKGRELDSDAISGHGKARRDAEAAKAAKAAEKAVPEAPAAPAKKVAGPDRTGEMSSLRSFAERERAKKAAPAKAAPSPVDDAEEAFKARVAEAGLPDKVADLRAQAREKKIRGFSTMNKRQLQSALLGDEVPKAGKIAPVSPKKMIPHLEAAESDQEARKLLENHTLADLKALAEARELELPKRGVTKDKVKDAVLADIRGVPGGAGGETPARSLRQELSAQKWVAPENPAAASKVQGIIDDTDEMDAAELRGSRDDLEKYSKELRADGNRQDANLVQTLADTMGMRAQVISGVEEGPARAPAKRAAKKAVPAVPEGEAPPKTLDKMLRTELAKVAADEGVDVKKSATKAQLKEAIERHRRAGGRESSEDRLRQELEAVPVEAPTPVKKAAPAAVVPDRAPTPEEIARDAAPTAPPAKRAKARALKRVPEGSVEGPRAAEKLDSEPRKSAFQEAWDGEGFADDPSLTEIRDDIASGKISQEEGVRRIQSEVSFNEEEISDLGAQLEGMAPEDRDEESGVADAIHARRAEVQDKITSQKKAAKFLRDHARDEAPVTRQELEVKLDGPEKAALDRVDVDSLKEAARQEGLGNIEGDDKDTLIQNIAKAIAGRELANQEKERTARDRQARIGESGKVAEALSNLDQMAQNDGSDKALQAGIRRLPAADRERLTKALGDRDQFRRELDSITKSRDLSRFGTVGETVPYDPQKHDVVGDVAPGSPVLITRAGHDSHLGGGDRVTFKARAIPDEGTKIPAKAPEAPAAPAKKAAKFLPPLASGQERKSATNVEVGDIVQRAGARNAPPARVVKVERGPGGIDITLEDGRKYNNNPNTAYWMGSGTPEAPSAPSRASRVKASTPRAQEVFDRLDDNENPPTTEEAEALLAPLNKGELVSLARGVSLPNPGSRNMADLRASVIEATSGRRRDSIATRNFTGERPGEGGLPVRPFEQSALESPPVKRVLAKAAVPAKAAPKPVVDLDNPTKHDAEVIGTGLGLDAKGEDKQWLAVVQKDLDNGVDGRQIADGLRRGADSERTLHNIEAESGGGTPDTGRAARINRMELMADRLEGVRPIPKPEPAKKTVAQQVRHFDTMRAQSASSKAQADLKAGKSHTEVATALRQAATSVGSRDHDPQLTSRVGDPTPSEMSAIKRSDARSLRELADEIKAEGVAQRAEARATKKARPSVTDDAVATLLMDRIAERDPAVAKAVLAEISPADRKELDAARERDTARKAARAAVPKKRTAAEMRRARSASESEGVPVDEILARWDGQKQDRKNLTGPVGEMIAAQIEDANQALLAADTPALESEATGRLLHPELRTWATKLGLSPSGTKAQLEKRIADRIKGREAPGASAERAVPKAPGGMTDQPPKPHSWGTFGQRGDQHYFHPDGQIPMAMKRLGPEGQLDVGDGESLHNAMGDIASDMVMGRISGDTGVARLRALATKLQAGSGARNMVARLADELDQPAVAMPRLPDDTPAPVRRLLQQVMTFPIARATGHFGSSTYEKSLVDKIADFVREKASGESSIVGMNDGLARLITNHTHESQEGSMGLRALTQPLFKDDSEISQALLAWAKEIRARRRST
jgi:hypothetical protein